MQLYFPLTPGSLPEGRDVHSERGGVIIEGLSPIDPGWLVHKSKNYYENHS